MDPGEFLAQVLSQIPHDSLAPGIALLPLHNHLPDIGIQRNLLEVHRAQRHKLRRPNSFL